MITPRLVESLNCVRAGEIPPFVGTAGRSSSGVSKVGRVPAVPRLEGGAS